MWQLGAPTVSLMAGLRLLAAIVLSKLILGASAVQSGLQARLASGEGGRLSWRSRAKAANV